MIRTWWLIAAFTPSTLPYLVPALSAPALSTDRVHIGINSLTEDYANEPLTSHRLLLLWVYWQAANNFTAYTAARSPRPEVPGVVTAPTEAFRVNRQNVDISTAPMFYFVLP